MSDQLIRAFDAELTEGDGRSVFGRVVPYGQVADVSDDGRTSYRESFELGAFARATKAPQHVRLTFEHDEGLRGIVGEGTALLERDDGLYGTFRVYDDPSGDGDKALHLIKEGALKGLSVMARALGPGRRRGGVVIRTTCHLEGVGLTRRPAYAGAEILAVRSARELEIPRNAEVDAILARVGYTAPDAG